MSRIYIQDRTMLADKAKWQSSKFIFYNILAVKKNIFLQGAISILFVN